MYRDKSNVSKLFLIINLIGVQLVICASENPNPAILVNDYVLRSCMSSVELNRRDVNVQGIKLPAASSQDPRVQAAILPVIKSSLSHHRGNSVETKTRKQSQTKLDSAIRERPAQQMITNTPLKTLNLERRGRNEEPQPFVRKDQLPEVESTKFNGEKNKNEASIIRIKSA